MAEIGPRVHVLLARRAPVGVVIRRGPSKRVCTILWDRRRDEFRLGQWLKGRIYERRSDLSPDGSHLIYFAMNGRWDSEAKGSWTAISRAPYLKAVALFPKGDCWHGGGLFTGMDTYWLNDGFGHSVLRDAVEVRRDAKYRPDQHFGGECLGVYYPRLLRDGWKLVQRENVAKWKDRDIFEKPAGSGWVLRKIAHAELGAQQGKGCYWDEHELVHLETGRCIRCPDWEWADLDGERLVWAAGGKLMAATLAGGGMVGEAELYDFGAMAFEPIEAPY
ncbi:hypothetical protein [Tautonia sociabilis]|uniref:Uncharacterized protein n=1 Tax=Tautonia sociabilis TaxID=2080755 RepID=A0A432MI18_9BACT|nr:hypothetical protein [Tautonia sociabilis]RUL87003.1 hypothetical protein TsocGM_14495 [Tautonia sociabilis]